jgi:hypothetical protein
MNNKDFAIFILTHGRPDNVITLATLKKVGYTGLVFFIIDNEDKKANEYYKNFGVERVKMFDKKKYADECDECNNFDERRTITMARNACFDIAKEIGVTYFMQLDDDYTTFRYTSDDKKEYRTDNKSIKNFDKLISFLLDFYKKTNALSLAIAQGGDFIGGTGSSVWKKKLARKCMNSFICSTERPFKFIGAMNEDVNTYTTLGSRGKLFLTVADLRLEQKRTQSQEGGISDMYLKYGTYCKAFTTVMNMPSSVKVAMMGVSDLRIHHKINWKYTVPKILSEELKKR